MLYNATAELCLFLELGIVRGQFLVVLFKLLLRKLLTRSVPATRASLLGRSLELSNSDRSVLRRVNYQGNQVLHTSVHVVSHVLTNDILLAQWIVVKLGRAYHSSVWRGVALFKSCILGCSCFISSYVCHYCLLNECCRTGFVWKCCNIQKQLMASVVSHRWSIFKNKIFSVVKQHFYLELSFTSWFNTFCRFYINRA